MNIKINTQSILDLTISAFFVFTSMTIMRFVIPEGNTTIFLLRGSKLVGIVFLALSVIFLISWFFNRNFKFKKKINTPNLKDLILVALPISPVINYALINNEYLVVSGLLFLIGVSLIFILFFSYIFPVIFSYLASINILMISGLALSFTIISIAKIYNNPDGHILNSLLVTQGVYLILSFLAVYLLYIFDKRIAYIAVIFFMITGIMVNFLNQSKDKLSKIQQPKRIVEFLNNPKNKIIKKKNIYVLVYESYANLETLNYYGFDNKEHLDFLENNNFKVYHGIYSNASTSLASTSRILEINGNLSQLDRYYTSGNAFALDIFKANGYKTIGLFKSPYFFGSSKISWDEYHPKESVTKMGGGNITKSIFEGNFEFDIFEDNYEYKDYLKFKEKYLTSIKKETLFYTHNSYPGHSGNSGKCATNEKQKYFQGMKKANIEMKNDVLNLLKNDPNSIIVLLSDHGPYLTKNCRNLKKYNINTINKYDIQDRYGAFLSIYWPKDISESENELVITQDIFPAILSNVTNNKNLFNELQIQRKFFDEISWSIAGINVFNGIINGGMDDGNPLFNKRSYKLPN